MNHVAIISQEQPHKHSAAITQIVEECLSEEMFVTLKKGEIHRFCSLLAAGGNPNAVNREGYSLLMVAVKENAEDFVDALVNAVVDINMRGPGGVTAMILAMAGGSYDIARTLLNNFTDLSGIRDGNSARKHGREDIARQVEMAKQSAFHAKKAAEKKKEIERAREEQETKGYFASLSANLTSSFSSAFDTAAAKTKSAKEYVWDIAATTKKKTVEKYTYAKECTSEFCSVFAKAAVSRTVVTKEYTKELFSKFFGKGTAEDKFASDIAVAAVEMLEKSKSPPAEPTVTAMESPAKKELAKDALAPKPPFMA